MNFRIFRRFHCWNRHLALLKAPSPCAWPKMEGVKKSMAAWKNDEKCVIEPQEPWWSNGMCRALQKAMIFFVGCWSLDVLGLFTISWDSYLARLGFQACKIFCRFHFWTSQQTFRELTSWRAPNTTREVWKAQNVCVCCWGSHLSSWWLIGLYRV